MARKIRKPKIGPSTGSSKEKHRMPKQRSGRETVMFHPPAGGGIKNVAGLTRAGRKVPLSPDVVDKVYDLVRESRAMIEPPYYVVVWVEYVGNKPIRTTRVRLASSGEISKMKAIHGSPKSAKQRKPRANATAADAPRKWYPHRQPIVQHVQTGG